MRLRNVGRVTAAWAAVLVVVATPVAAHAASTDTPAVDVIPVGTTHSDPNAGLWFVHRLAAGAHGHGQAMLINPARVPQVVRLYARDVDFSPAGVASVSNDAQAGIASWVHVRPSVVRVPASSRLTVDYDVVVPPNADPGDHTGAIVAESGPLSGGHVTVIKRIATRFYVTVPGHVVVAFRFGQFARTLHSPLWPHSLDTRVTLVNTGTIRFVPGVTIGGRPAVGSTLVLAHSIEPFTVKLHVPWYGGHIHVRVIATADGAHQQVMTKSFWVIPWLLIAVALVLLGALVHATAFVVRRWRRRRAQERALRARVAELESALPAQRTAVDDGTRVSS